MPVVARELDAIRGYGFVFSVFLTTFLLGVVVSGAWTDARGPAWPLRAGLVLFAAGLVMSGLADSLAVLLIGRAVAGAGGGLLIIAIYVVIAAIYPPDVRPRVFSWLSAGWILPSIVGPALAGWLAEDVTWRAVFLLVPPLIVPPALALLPRLRGDGRREGVGSPMRRVLAGCGLSLGVAGLQWGLERLGAQGRAGWPIGVTVVGATLVALTFPRLVPAGTVRLRRGMPTVVVLRGLYTASFLGVEAFIPLMLVTQRGFSATEAGLILTGGALGWSFGAYVQGRPGLRLPRHVMLSVGAVAIAIGVLLLTSTVRPPVPAWLAVPIWGITAAGMGMAYASTSVVVLALSPPGEAGRNSAGLQLSDGLGSALGIALAGAFFAANHDPAGGDAWIFVTMWLAGAAVAVFAAVLALRARPPSPSPTP